MREPPSQITCSLGLTSWWWYFKPESVLSITLTWCYRWTYRSFNKLGWDKQERVALAMCFYLFKADIFLYWKQTFCFAMNLSLVIIGKTLDRISSFLDEGRTKACRQVIWFVVPHLMREPPSQITCSLGWTLWFHFEPDFLLSSTLTWCYRWTYRSFNTYGWDKQERVAFAMCFYLFKADVFLYWKKKKTFL